MLDKVIIELTTKSVCSKLSLGILLMLLVSTNLYGKSSQEIKEVRTLKEVKIYFTKNSAEILLDKEQNRDNINELSSFINELNKNNSLNITEIKIESFASPEGSKDYNYKLTQKRTNTLYSYLTNELNIPQNIITHNNIGIAWDKLIELVSKSNMQYKEEVINIIKNVPEETWRRIKPTDRWVTLVDSRIKHLMDLRCGVPYNQMYDNLFPELRASSIITIYLKRLPIKEEKAEQPAPKEIIAEPETPKPAQVKPEQKKAPVQEKTQVVVAEAKEEAKEEPKEAIAPADSIKKRKNIKLALKTNLLYDAALIPNIKLEIPIKDRFSVAAEWIFPWWVTKNNGNALQMLSGNVEGKYWFGNRETKPQLTGLYAGIYAGGGYYDLQFKNNGYQGEFFIAAGLQGGYAHTINKSGSLRMEYALGLGYLKTNYRYYEGKEDNEFLVWKHNGNYTWIGPTRAEVSLVWFINWARAPKIIRGGEK